MKFSKVSRRIVVALVSVHRWCLRKDQQIAELKADMMFKKAAAQLDMVRAAKDHLAKLQQNALEQRLQARITYRNTKDELQALSVFTND